MDNLLPPGSSRSDIHISVPPFLPAIIGISIIIAAALGSYAFYAVHAMDNVLTVTGSAKTHVTSDSVKWRMSLIEKTNEFKMQSAYPLLAKDLSAVTAFLKTNGITDDQVTVSQVFVEQIYNNNQNGGPQEYNLRQEIVVESKDVHGIDALSKKITELSAQGIFLQWNQLEYYVSNLPDLRVSLLGDAVKDAHARAVEIAKAGGQSVGSLKSASSGVVQVLAPNSIEVTDYGSYDTQSLEKDVMVTARATFFVR